MNNYNTRLGPFPAAHQEFISPQALVIGPSIASSSEYAADAAHLNYPYFDQRSEELRNRLTAEINVMNTPLVQVQSNTTANVTATARTVHTTENINASEDAYNNAWKGTAQSEDMRMDHLELEFGRPTGVPDYANIWYDGGYLRSPSLAVMASILMLTIMLVRLFEEEMDQTRRDETTKCD